MKLLETLLNVVKSKPKTKNIYMSLAIESDHVSGACFYISDNSTPKLLHAVMRRVSENNWDERIVAVDQIISSLESKLESVVISDVILGLPQMFLTADGSIKADIKTNLKKLTEQLELNPVGFVSLPDAIIYKLKFDDGVPASVILLLVSDNTIDLYIYKVGMLVGHTPLKFGATVLPDIESALKSFTGVEVLPSKILLYGVDKDRILSLQSKLTAYSWPEKVNFLHIPKVEILTIDALVRSISFAGAGELKKGVVSSSTEIVQKSADLTDSHASFKIQSESQNDSVPNLPHENVKSETVVPISADSSDESEQEDTIDFHESVTFDDTKKNEADIEERQNLKAGYNGEESNIRQVAPEEIGFHPNEDILEEKYNLKATKSDIKKNKFKTDDAAIAPQGSAKKQTELFAKLKPLLAKIKNSVKGKGIIATIIFGLLVIAFGLYYVLFTLIPKATVNIAINPDKINVNKKIIIDPKAANINFDTMTIPAKKLEHTVSGEETIKVTGIKNIGDPASGQVTIYNKSLTTKTLKKGTVLESNGLNFTLDDEVKVASASESIGSITFGKTNASVTAVQIGTKGNLAANSEFDFEDYDTDVLIARNDQPFTGGTSKEVTVVSRKDYDALTKKATDKLIKQAKTELAASVGGSQILIDDTVSSTVSDKIFQEELDQEAKDLHGKITLTVTGYAYDQTQIQTMFNQQLASTAKAGYSVNSDNIEVVLKDIKIGKTGVIEAGADASAFAVPKLNPEEIKSSLAGKDLKQAQEYLKTLPGISEVNFFFSAPYAKSKIPRRTTNIQLEIEIKK